MAEYLFELLLEEIPAWMHDAAHATLRQQFAQVLGSSPIVNSTPRRLIVYLPNIPEREADRDEEVKGPPAKAAYDADGKPTQALHMAEALAKGEPNRGRIALTLFRDKVHDLRGR